MANYKGLDIANWQEGMNIKQWKDALNLDFIILKVGGNEGGRYRDKCFDGFYKQTKACGLHVGAYYYTTSTTTSASHGRSSVVGRPAVLTNRSPYKGSET